MIGVVAYGMGNIQSVCNAFDYLGHPVTVVETPDDLNAVERIVLPGVGAFPSAMARLHDTGFARALDEQVRERGKPVLGICLGMQLLAEEGTEFRQCPGLGWIPGRIEIIERETTGLRLPQIGWNELAITGDSPLLAGLGNAPCCYFVHSYHFRPRDPAHIEATVDYGGPVTAAVAHGNIFGVQFHPEKSQKVGLKVLDNFARLEMAR